MDEVRKRLFKRDPHLARHIRKLKAALHNTEHDEVSIAAGGLIGAAIQQIQFRKEVSKEIKQLEQSAMQEMSLTERHLAEAMKIINKPPHKRKK
jgi:N-acetylglutamate synthase/N-acetylornithine aminotransferase